MPTERFRVARCINEYVSLLATQKMDVSPEEIRPFGWIVPDRSLARPDVSCVQIDHRGQRHLVTVSDDHAGRHRQ